VVHIVGIFLEHLIKTIHIEKNYQEVNRGSGDSTNSLGTHLRLQSLSTRDVHDQNTTESVRKGSNFSPLPRWSRALCRQDLCDFCPKANPEIQTFSWWPLHGIFPGLLQDRPSKFSESARDIRRGLVWNRGRKVWRNAAVVAEILKVAVGRKHHLPNPTSSYYIIIQ